MLAVLAVSCGRHAEEAWSVPELPSLSLAEGLAPDEAGTGRLTLRRASSDGTGRAYAVRLEHEVRMRGRGQAPLAVALEEEFDLAEAESGTGNGGAAVEWTVRSPEVNVDPAREETKSLLERDLARVTLRRPLTGTGVGPGEPADGAAREVGESMDRLLAVLPGREVAPGDTWPMRTSSARLPGNGAAAAERTGTVRFEGVVTQDEAGYALLLAEWDVAIRGEGVLANQPGRVLEGSGRGRAAWLVEPSTGLTVRAEAVEATHVRAEVGKNGRAQVLEQVATLRSELARKEVDE